MELSALFRPHSARSSDCNCYLRCTSKKTANSARHFRRTVEKYVVSRAMQLQHFIAPGLPKESLRFGYKACGRLEKRIGLCATGGVELSVVRHEVHWRLSNIVDSQRSALHSIIARGHDPFPQSPLQ